MFNDAVDLWEFYGTSLGQLAQRMIRRRVREIWPNLHGLDLMGLGYATPVVRPFRDEAARVFQVMPAQQGVMKWPREGPGLVTLADEAELPLPDVSVDRVLMVHAVECSEQLRDMLEEVWRVLTGDGRVVVVVPNRSGLWSRSDATPFGHGHPYTPRQLSRLLRDTMFTPVRTESALFVPPTRMRLLLRSAAAIEDIGARWFPRFAGVVLIEATKQIYASRPVAKTVLSRRRRLIPVPAPRISVTRSDVRPLAIGPGQD